MFTAFNFCCNDKSLGIIYPPPDCVSVPLDPDGACIPLIITLSSCSNSLLIVYLVIAPPCNPFNATNGSGVTSKNVGVTVSIDPIACSLYVDVPPFQQTESTFNVNPVAPTVPPVVKFAAVNVTITVPNVVPNPAAFNTVDVTVSVSPTA
jgi:hypothetical protein